MPTPFLVSLTATQAIPWPDHHFLRALFNATKKVTLGSRLLPGLPCLTPPPALDCSYRDVHCAKEQQRFAECSFTSENPCLSATEPFFKLQVLFVMAFVVFNYMTIHAMVNIVEESHRIVSINVILIATVIFASSFTRLPQSQFRYYSTHIMHRPRQRKEETSKCPWPTPTPRRTNWPNESWIAMRMTMCPSRLRLPPPSFLPSTTSSRALVSRLGISPVSVG